MEPGATAYLSITRSNAVEDVPLLGSSTWRLGRGSQCSIVLEDDLVSRNHAMIQRTESSHYILIDMGSRNGSFVNGRRISMPVRLRNGDQVTLGNAQMVFHDPRQAANQSIPDLGEEEATVCQLKQCLVSVLVVDIRGFTVMSQQMEESLLCQLTGSWFSEAYRIMDRHGSSAQKYIGDAVMAVWQHRTKGNEAAEILEILRALSEFAAVTADLSAKFGLPEGLKIGAGVNTGIATVGNTGTHGVADYTATGECVNMAFRLESATKSLQADLCLGKKTSDFLRQWPRAEAYLKEHEVELKGYDEPVATYPVTFGVLKGFLESLETVGKPV